MTRRRLLVMGGLLLACGAVVVVLAGSATADPTVRITSPANNSNMVLNWTEIHVEITNFTLDPNAVGQAPVNGTGHFHVFLDGAYLFYSASTTIVVPDLPAGTHTVRVGLYNNDHTPLSPPVRDELTLTVEGKRAAIAVLSPANGSIIWGDRANVTVAMVNFTLDPASVGMAPVQGSGHWHIFLDGAYVDFVLNTSRVVTGLTPGTHQIRAALYNHDHTPLAVRVSATVTVTVAALPSVTIISPPSGSVVTATAVDIQLEIRNLTLDAAAVGAAPAAGHGHYHVSVDGAYVGFGATATYTVSNLTTGRHVIEVSLHNNDHSPIPGASAATISLETATPRGGFLPALGPIEACAALLVAALAVLLNRGRGRPANRS